MMLGFTSSAQPAAFHGKIWIQRDSAKHGVAPELIRARIPKERIVLVFRLPEVRKHTEYAVG